MVNKPQQYKRTNMTNKKMTKGQNKTKKAQKIQMNIEQLSAPLSNRHRGAFFWALFFHLFFDIA